MGASDINMRTTSKIGAFLAAVALAAAVDSGVGSEDTFIVETSMPLNIAVLLVSVMVSMKMIDEKSSKFMTLFKLAMVACVAYSVIAYLPWWYQFTPGGRGGENNLDTARQDPQLLASTGSPIPKRSCNLVTTSKTTKQLLCC